MLGSILAALLGSAAIPSAVIEDIAATRTIAKTGDALWPGFSDAPFGLLLVAEDAEYLFCDERTPGGFAALADDLLTGCPVRRGPRTWRSPSLLAAMPLFGPGEVIVMGPPEGTGLSRQEWRRTILHEHFHQWQGQLPGYYARTAALDLADGDETGMWMIQYPFPYSDAAVAAAYREAADALVAALNAQQVDLRAATAAYLERRKALATASGERNWRYFEFQLWKEGVARWTEVEMARRAGGVWAQEAEGYWSKQLHSLRHDDLPDLGRVSVYPYGAAEAALLERVDPDWRGCYRMTLQLGDCWSSLGMAQAPDDRSLHAP